MSVPSLASLVAAVRATPALASFVASRDDAALAEIVRTARTEKGAIWLATRVAGPAAPTPTQVEGRWATALSCLQALADGGDEAAAMLLEAHEQIVAAIAADDPEVSLES